MYAPRTSPPPTRSTFAPHISAPRHGSRSDSGSGSRLPLFFRRMIKFPQMDFEVCCFHVSGVPRGVVVVANRRGGLEDGDMGNDIPDNSS